MLEGPLYQCQVVRGVLPLEGRRLAADLQALEGVLPKGLQHQGTGFAVGRLLLPQKAVVFERCQVVHHVERGGARSIRGARGGADRLGGLQRATPYEHCQAGEERLLARRQKGIAPVDGAPERLLASRQVTPPARQQPEPAAQARQQRLRRQELDARGGQFQGQGQAVQPATELGHGRRVGVRDLEVWSDRSGALDEQGHGLVLGQRRRLARVARRGQRQRGHWVHALAGEPEPGPARRQHLQPSGGRQ
jgi:hypothetical protein